jgi:hypothetical protein
MRRDCHIRITGSCDAWAGVFIGRWSFVIGRSSEEKNEFGT